MYVYGCGYVRVCVYKNMRLRMWYVDVIECMYIHNYVLVILTIYWHCISHRLLEADSTIHCAVSCTRF